MNSQSIAPPQSLEVMKRSPYFRGWDDQRLARLARGSRLTAYRKGEELVHKGDTLRDLQIVIQGQVRVALRLPNGTERVIELVGRGETFGEACLVEDTPTPYHVIANVNSRLLAIDGGALIAEMQRDPAFCFQMLKRVSKRLLGMLTDTEVCAQRSGTQRVACFLMRHKPDHASESFVFELPASKRDVAAKIGLAPETFSRVLARLRQQGAIRVQGRRIEIKRSQVLMDLLPRNAIPPAAA